MNDETKGEIELHEVASSPISDTVLSSEQEKDYRRAWRKLDFTLIPVLAMFNFLSYLDRTNIGNARIAGMQSDLGLTDQQFTLAIAIFYVPYILTELPSNLVLKKIGPNILLLAVLTSWGIVVIAQGFVKNNTGILIIRVFLGLLEGPMFPGLVLYLAGFYPRKEMSLRIALFASASSLAGAFSGLLAAALSQMNGIGGLAGWRWIFIIEGVITTVVGFLGFFLVPASPEHAWVLSVEEKRAVMKVLAADKPPIGFEETFAFREIPRAFFSPHVFFVFVVFILGGAVGNGLAIFVPSIINDLEFTPNQSQLLSVGPFGAAFVASLCAAWVSDKYNQRGPPLVFLTSLLTAGWAIFYASRSVWLSYASFFLMVPGIYAATPIAAAWLSNNSEPFYRRACAIAFGFMATNIGGIISATQFPRKAAPRYTTATLTNLSFSIIMVLSALSNIFLLGWMNSRKAANREKILSPFAAADDKEAWLVLGDKHPDFKYIQ